MADWTRHEFEQLIYDQLSEYKHSTVSSWYYIMKAFQKYARSIDVEWMKFNIDDLNISFEKSTTKDYLSEAEQDYIKGSIMRYRLDGIMYKIFIVTGIRNSEFQQVLEGLRTYDHSKGILIKGKSKNTRVIFVTEDLLADVSGNSGEAKITELEGTTEDSRRRILRSIKTSDNDKAREIYPHLLRHTFATNWVNRGGNLAALQRLMGHESITTTMDYVSIATDEIRRNFDLTVSNKTGNLRIKALEARNDYLEKRVKELEGK